MKRQLRCQARGKVIKFERLKYLTDELVEMIWNFKN